MGRQSGTARAGAAANPSARSPSPVAAIPRRRSIAGSVGAASTRRAAYRNSAPVPKSGDIHRASSGLAELLDPVVARVGDVDVAVGVDRNAPRIAELALLGAEASPVLE